MQDKCVLICDSHEDIRTICNLILHKEYRVETIANCENLFEVVERVKPGIILIDLWMPKIDGKSAAQALLANNQTKHIPIILFSTDNNLEKISQTISATAFIKKPFDINELRETIRKYL